MFLRFVLLIDDGFEQDDYLRYGQRVNVAVVFYNFILLVSRGSGEVLDWGSEIVLGVAWWWILSFIVILVRCGVFLFGICFHFLVSSYFQVIFISRVFCQWLAKWCYGWYGTRRDLSSVWWRKFPFSKGNWSYCVVLCSKVLQLLYQWSSVD